MRSKLCSFLLSVLFLSASCKKNDKQISDNSKKSTDKLTASSTTDSSPEKVMTIDHQLPPVSQLRRKKPSPRIKSVNFQNIKSSSTKLPHTKIQPSRIAAGNFFGKNKQLIYLSKNRIRLLNLKGQILAEKPAPASPRLVKTLKNPKTGNDELAVAWGRGRKKNTSVITLSIYRFAEGKIIPRHIYSPSTQRPDPVSLHIHKNKTLYFAFHINKYKVKIVKTSKPFVDLKEIGIFKMISNISTVNYNKKNHLVVSRIYGDKPGSPGELFLLSPSGKKVKLPSLRGVRGLLAANVNSTPEEEILIGDGWDKNYGKIARPLLSKLKLNSENKFEKEIVDEIKNNFSIIQIEKADLDGDKKIDIVVKGNNIIKAYFPSQNWKSYVLAKVSGFDPFVVSDIDNDGKDELLLVNPYPQTLKLRLE
ncbi:MAG: FG-GAP repeat domain-containing protein [Myxococcota bacterium]